jgi:hypothetical protein
MTSNVRERTCSSCDQVVEHPAVLARVGRSWLRLCPSCQTWEARYQAAQAEEAAAREAAETARWVERLNRAADAAVLDDDLQPLVDQALARFGSPRNAAAARARIEARG